MRSSHEEVDVFLMNSSYDMGSIAYTRNMTLTLIFTFTRSQWDVTCIQVLAVLFDCICVSMFMLFTSLYVFICTCVYVFM